MIRTARASASSKRVLISAAAIDRGNRDFQQSEVNRQLTAVVVPVVEHDRSEQPDARNREHFFPFRCQTPVSHGGRFANPAEVLFGSFDARLERGENLFRVVWSGRIKIRSGDVEPVLLRKV